MVFRLTLVSHINNGDFNIMTNPGPTVSYIRLPETRLWLQATSASHAQLLNVRICPFMSWDLSVSMGKGGVELRSQGQGITEDQVNASPVQYYYHYVKLLLSFTHFAGKLAGDLGRTKTYINALAHLYTIGPPIHQSFPSSSSSTLSTLPCLVILFHTE